MIRLESIAQETNIISGLWTGVLAGRRIIAVNDGTAAYFSL